MQLDLDLIKALLKFPKASQLPESANKVTLVSVTTRSSF